MNMSKHQEISRHGQSLYSANALDGDNYWQASSLDPIPNGFP
jgi:hypothetical protein